MAMIMISPAEVRASGGPDHSSTLDPNEAAKLKLAREADR